MNTYQYKTFTIQVIDDPTYTVGSANNKFTYLKTYYADEAERYPTSKHGIKILGHDDTIISCVIIGSGGSDQK